MACLGTVAAAETVYKWVDGQGQVHYMDLPPRQGDAKILGVYQQEAGIVDEVTDGDDFSDEGSGSPAEPGDMGPGDAPEPPISHAAAAAAEADAAKARVEQCKAAQDRYELYINSRRLFREMPDGKREYLTDQEITQARARAKQTVDDYCR